MNVGDQVRYRDGMGPPGVGEIVGVLKGREPNGRIRQWFVVQWADRRSACSALALELVH